ncbi:lysoplasmalogenase [Paucibacter sp. APW11]|uniref:Lysoplasmalogenase n=1 Tax=Roseateles aquae TaxID=3077235 RepID=A0ABU3PD48_9BURK|nr:lysoplasmalogenase [Paucibacter sp. APW11]MDT9000022.1 lysoplasmalogenase [Paucibacter sp. APW11]
MRNYRLLPLLTLISALLAIVALDGLGLPREMGFIAKPLTTVLIILFAWPRGEDTPVMARRIRFGLLFSLGGDVFLLWPEQGFLPGLLSFLLAHLCYIAAFCVPTRLARPLWPLLMFAAIAVMVLLKLWPGIAGDLRAPVVIYVACLATMAAQAWAWWRSAMGTAAEARARLAAWGGTLFMFSDALIAINKFAVPLPYAALLVLSSYWLAQSFFTLSLEAPRR